MVRVGLRELSMLYPHDNFSRVVAGRPAVHKSKFIVRNMIRTSGPQ